MAVLSRDTGLPFPFCFLPDCLSSLLPYLLWPVSFPVLGPVSARRTACLAQFEVQPACADRGAGKNHGMNSWCVGFPARLEFELSLERQPLSMPALDTELAF